MTTARIAPARYARRIIAALVVGLSAVLGLAAPAHAFVEPIDPGSNVSPAVNDGQLPALTSGPGTATIVAAVVVVLVAAAIGILATRAARHRREVRPAALHA